MAEHNALVVFQDKKIRRIWHNNEWYFSVIDIIAVLTEQDDAQTARKYWNKLSQRLREEGSEVVTNCHRLKLPAQEGGEIAGDARKKLEIKSGKKVVTNENYLEEAERMKELENNKK